MDLLLLLAVVQDIAASNDIRVTEKRPDIEAVFWAITTMNWN
jgi:hypothetical protein